MNQLLTLVILFISFIGFSQSPFLYRDVPTVATLPDMSNNIQFIDLDNDGDEDLINIVNNTIRIYTSNGIAIDSLNHIEISIPGGNQISFVDWDQDGLKDIVTIIGSLGVFDIKILKNSGGFTFDAPFSIYNGYNSSFDVTDVNADGYPDLVSLFNNQVTIFENQGGNLAVNTTSFVYPLAHLGSGTKTILFEDVDNDGLKEMVFKSTWNKIYIYSHTGTYDYTLQDSIISTSIGKLDYPQSIFLYDLNNDGKNEIITRNGGTFSVFSWQSGFDYNVVYSGNATYTVSGGSTIATTIPLSDFYDVDQDGFLDIVAGNYVFFNNGNFTFNRVIINSSAVFDTPDYKCTDMDNDGNTDICYVYTIANLITSTSEYEAFFRSENNTGQVIEPKQLIWHLWGYTNTDGDVVDFDNDGDMDVFGFNRGKTILWENINDTLFPKVLSSGLPYFTSYVDFVDINQDGYPDIVYDVLNDLGNDQHRYRLNSGGTTLGNVQVIGNSDMLLKLIDDIDDDGIDELFYHLTSGSSNTVYMYKLNTGVPVLATSFSWSQLSVKDAMIRIGDYNLDGFKDIVIQMKSTSGSTNRLFIAKNNGSNNFSVVQNISSGNAASLIGIVDADGDSYPDIICHNDNNRIYSFKNNQGTISSSVSTISTLPGMSGATGMQTDFNGDGLDDLVVQSFSSSGNQFLFRNNGNGFTHISTVPNPRRLVSVQDIDNDGDEDVICTNAWYENTSNALFEMQGLVFYDVNENGVFDSPTDITFPYFPIELNSGWGTFYTDENGYFETSLGSVEGNYSFAIDPSVSTQFAATTTPYPSIVTVNNANPQGSAEVGVSNLFNNMNGTFDINLLGNRCNEPGRIVLNYQNFSPEVATAQLKLVLAENSSFISSNQVPVQSTDTLLWELTDLNPFEHGNFYADIQLPPTSSMGDTMVFYAEFILNGVSLGSDTLTDQIQQILTCAYDPNDKQITMNENVYFGDSTFLYADDLEYTIRFQNTGNDTAVNVVIVDNLSDKFDWNSVKPISASHSYNFSIDSIGRINVTFKNIYLPDSTTDLLGSMGYIKFKLKYRENAPHYVLVNNYARIYFDQNPPIFTDPVSFYRVDCKDFVNINTIPSLCEYKTLQVSNTRPNFFQFTQLWSIDNQTATTSSASFSGLTPGEQILNFKLTNNACQIDTNITITVYPKPDIVLNVGSLTHVCLNDTFTVTANYNVNWSVSGGNYTWNSLGTGTELVRPYTSSTYLRAIYSENNCSDTVSFTILIKNISTQIHNSVGTYYVCPDDVINMQSNYDSIIWNVNYTNNPTLNYSDTSTSHSLFINNSPVVLNASAEVNGCTYKRTSYFHLVEELQEENLKVRIDQQSGFYSHIQGPLVLNDTTYICTSRPYSLRSPTKTNWYKDGVLLSYNFNFTPTQSGTYQVGCDKIPFTIILNQSEQISNTIYLCPGSNYTYSDGTTVTNIQANQTHVSTQQDFFLCNTVTTTNLIVISPTATMETIQLCPGANYTYPDGTTLQNLQSNTSHVSYLASVNGCDSAVVTTHLELLTPLASSETVQLCIGENYTYPDGTTVQNLQSNASHVSHIPNATGCDSLIITTNLQLLTPLTSSETVQLCIGGNYTYPDGTTVQNLQSDALYVSHIPNATGCDSLIITTNLQLLTPLTSSETIQLCIGSDYTYPDGTTVQNLQSDALYVSHIPNANGCDSLIITTNLDVLIPLTSSETIQLCIGSDYTYPDGTTVQNLQSNTSYVSHILNATGCDSLIVTTNLETKQVDFVTTVTSSSIEVVTNGTSIQWLDCNAGYAPISQQTGSTFHPTEDGNYAAEINYSGCIDTTECINITLLDVASLNQNGFRYFPNPVKKELIILLPEYEKEIEVFVRDVNGRAVVFQKFENSSELILPFDELSEGVYIVTVRTPRYEKQIKIHKED